MSAALCESAEIIASGGAASGSPRPDLEDTGAAGGHPVHLLTGDADAPTMEEHLELHPEDRPCPNCDGDGTDGVGGSSEPCPRCLGDGRRGEDCPECGGAGGWRVREGFITYAYGSSDWDDDWEECDAQGCRCGRLVEATR